MDDTTHALWPNSFQTKIRSEEKTALCFTLCSILYIYGQESFSFLYLPPTSMPKFSKVDFKELTGTASVSCRLSFRCAFLSAGINSLPEFFMYFELMHSWASRVADARFKSFLVPLLVSHLVELCSNNNTVLKDTWRTRPIGMSVCGCHFLQASAAEFQHKYNLW